MKMSIYRIIRGESYNRADDLIDSAFIVQKKRRWFGWKTFMDYTPDHACGGGSYAPTEFESIEEANDFVRDQLRSDVETRVYTILEAPRE